MKNVLREIEYSDHRRKQRHRFLDNERLVSKGQQLHIRQQERHKEPISHQLDPPIIVNNQHPKAPTFHKILPLRPFKTPVNIEIRRLSQEGIPPHRHPHQQCGIDSERFISKLKQYLNDSSNQSFRTILPNIPAIR